MAYCPSNSVPATGPSSARPQESARAQRVNQAQYVGDRLRNGLPPVAIAGVAALLTQLDTMQTLPGVSLSIVTEVAGYRRALTCTNSAWNGYDLTHQFLDERSTAVYGPSHGTRFEQEASLRMMPANVPSLPPTSAPNPEPMTPTFSGSPAFGAPYGTQQMTLQAPVNQPVSDREGFYYLQAAAQPSGCETPTTLTDTASMDAETIAGSSGSTTAGPNGSTTTGPREEAGRKRVTGKSVAAARTGSVTESPTSRPPPDKRAGVPQQPQMKSVVIVRPPYRVGHLGRGAPQTTMQEAIEQYGDADAGPEVSSVPSGTGSADMSLEVPEAIEEASPPAFLPPSDDVSGSVVTSDSKRIWMAAERLHPNMCAVRRRAPPTEADQKEVNRITIAAQITRVLRPRDADMSEQTWEQRAREQLPVTPNDYMAPLQHNITEQFPARYTLRDGETWEANARYARNIISMKPLLKGTLQRARYCVARDSTCRSDLPIDNLMPDVLVLTMPLSRFAEVGEMVGVMCDPNLRGSLKEPPPQRVIFANLLDHMVCEGLLRDLDTIMADTRRPGNIASLVNIVADAMERAAGILRGRLGALALFVSRRDSCTGSKVSSNSSTSC